MVKEACFFCTSPYQIFSILSISQNIAGGVDVYVMKQFGKADEYVDRLALTGLFDKVIMVDEASFSKNKTKKHNKLWNYMNAAFSYTNVDELAKNVLLPDIEYNNFYISSRAYIPRMVQFSLMKKNAKTKYCYFDDGLGSYFNSVYDIKKFDLILRWLLFRKKKEDFEFDKYLFSPDFYKKTNPENKEVIHAIKPYWNDRDSLRAINSIFGYTEENAIQQKYILFGEAAGGSKTNSFHDELEDVFRAILEKVGRNNTILKNHPRNERPHLPGMSYYTDYNMPFECICFNCDISNKVLVSLRSTGVITPKMLTGQEPFVILLYEMEELSNSQGNNTISELSQRFFEAFREVYNNKEKIFIPKNTEELIDAINTIEGITSDSILKD